MWVSLFLFSPFPSSSPLYISNLISELSLIFTPQEKGKASSSSWLKVSLGMTLLKAGIFVYYMHDMNADKEVKSGYVFSENCVSEPPEWMVVKFDVSSYL